MVSIKDDRTDVTKRPIESSEPSPEDEVEKVEVVLRKIHDASYSMVSICGDPMNGCPDDFAEDYIRKIDRLVLRAYTQGISDEAIGRAIDRGQSRASEDLEEMFG